MLLLTLQDVPADATADADPALLNTVRALALQYGTKVLAALAILILGWFVARLFTGAVRKALRRGNVDATLARFLGNLVQMLAMTFVVIAAISKLGVETASFVAVLGAAGFAVGFALQGSLSNFAAGVMIMVFRPFRAGDLVDAGGTSGIVDEVGIFNTVVLTLDNKRVIVANSAITGNNITNYSALPTRRVDLQFGLAYGDDVRRAKQLVLEVLAKDARVLKDPAPVVALGELGESGVKILCRPWVKTEHYWDVTWDTLENVKHAFEAAGFTAPHPQRDVHLHQVA